MTIVRAKEETMALQDTITLLLQCMRFVENKKKSVILGMLTNSKERTISLPQKKIKISKKIGQDLYQILIRIVLKLKKKLGHLTSTILAKLPANLDACQRTYIPVSKHTLVPSLKARIFNSKQPQPKYTFLVMPNCFKLY